MCPWPLGIKVVQKIHASLFVSPYSAGIGKATVERLAGEGASVAIFDINKSAGEKLASDLSSKSQKASYFNVDVSSKEQCVEAVNQVATAHSGQIHSLVNCAVYFGSKGLTAEKADWDKSFSVNVAGYANMVQACHQYMSKMEGDKSIVNIASISAHRCQPDRWTYAATKGAIHTMTKCMALDLSKDKIRVNAVSPAWVWSPEVEKAAGGDREKWEPIWGAFHMPRRLCETSEVASVICFLLSDDASYVTSSDIPVDGGFLNMSAEGFGDKSSFAGTKY